MSFTSEKGGECHANQTLAASGRKLGELVTIAKLITLWTTTLGS